MIETALWFFLAMYGFYATILVVGIVRESRRSDFSQSQPFVSVVIPVRDEERNVQQCLESVLSQTYPLTAFEVILVNDNSSDRTWELASAIATHHPNLKIVNVEENSARVGKLVALDQGIKYAKGELLLLTDGDIVVQRSWLEQMVRHMSAGVGIAGGLTLPKGNSVVAKMQTLDWAFLLGIACGAIGLKKPLSIIANNFALRRAAHDEVGGFSSVRNSVDDDFLMLKDVVGKTKWGARFVLRPDCVNETLPCDSIYNALSQKHRWGRGGFGLNVFGYSLILTSAATHYLLLLQSIADHSFPIVLWLLKCVADAAIIATTLSIVRRKKLFIHFLWFQLYYVIYIVVMPFWILFVRDVEWKGRVYEKVT